MPLSVLTLNIWNLNEPLQWRLSRITDFLFETKPDIVAFQEVSLLNGQPEFSTVADKAGYPFAEYVPCGRWEGREEGLAILARTRFSPTSRTPLPPVEGDMPRFLQIVTFESADHLSGIRLANTHLAYSLQAREARTGQVSQIVRTLQSFPSTQPLILCGDFNDVPESEPVRRLVSPPLGLTDCWAAADQGAGDTFAIHNSCVLAQREMEKQRSPLV
jgi:endonuclease/exonuclease/phosphatase family metal-dependent hydrolase